MCVCSDASHWRRQLAQPAQQCSASPTENSHQAQQTCPTRTQQQQYRGCFCKHPDFKQIFDAPLNPGCLHVCYMTWQHRSLQGQWPLAKTDYLSSCCGDHNSIDLHAFCRSTTQFPPLLPTTWVTCCKYPPTRHKPALYNPPHHFGSWTASLLTVTTAPCRPLRFTTSWSWCSKYGLMYSTEDQFYFYFSDYAMTWLVVVMYHHSQPLSPAEPHSFTHSHRRAAQKQHSPLLCLKPGSLLTNTKI